MRLHRPINNPKCSELERDTKCQTESGTNTLVRMATRIPPMITAVLMILVSEQAGQSGLEARTAFGLVRTGVHMSPGLAI